MMQNEKAYLVGIVSRGRGCAKQNFVGVYTRSAKGCKINVLIYQSVYIQACHTLYGRIDLSLSYSLVFSFREAFSDVQSNCVHSPCSFKMIETF